MIAAGGIAPGGRALDVRITVRNVSTIATIGAGLIGSQVARLAVQHGYKVVVSNSRGPETLADLVAELGPGRAVARTRSAEASCYS